MDGFYYDPQHGGCMRAIRRDPSGAVVIYGVYGFDEAKRPGSTWYATVQVTGGHFLTVDFVGKTTTHARVLHALWCPDAREIHWEDGNVWKKVNAWV